MVTTIQVVMAAWFGIVVGGGLGLVAVQRQTFPWWLPLLAALGGGLLGGLVGAVSPS